MAGQPRLAAKRLAAVEEQVYAAYVAMTKLRPRQYAARADDDEASEHTLCSAWNDAWDGLREAAWDLDVLLSMLEARAGEPQAYLERARSRGLLAEQGAAEAAAEAAGAAGEAGS